MRLEELLGRRNVPSIEIQGISSDSRTIEPGYLFVAVQGKVFDGHQFVDDAIERGAVCVLSERRVKTPRKVKVICDPALVAMRNQLATRFYDDPSVSLKTIGITGTNGKTSVAYGLASTLPKCGIAGSLGWGSLDNLKPSELTTMDGVGMQRCLATIRSDGFETIAFEASSHALDQGRIDGMHIDVGVFTNLSRDHLDYHGCMEAYAAAKQKLFEEFDLSHAILNQDDKFGLQLLRVCQSRGISTTTYGASAEADVSFELANIGPDGATGTWRTKWGDAPLDVSVRGGFGVMNCAAVLATQLSLGYALPDIVDRFNAWRSAPGRFEFIPLSEGRHAVIDFAHTPDALNKTLGALGDLNPREIVCVFGCGGDRDQGKREQMGQVAELLADRVIVTNDNPRSESPERIAQMVVTGFDDPSSPQVILDRREAISNAIESLAEGGIVLIAGKGVEPYQEIMGVKHPFSDHEVVVSLGGGI